MDAQTNNFPVSLFNDGGCAQLLLVCEHASNFIPADLNNLELSEEILQSHIAHDIGALDLARRLSWLLDAPLISSAASRLIYDCNRSFGLTDTIPVKSEIFEIPGNFNLNDTEVLERHKKYYLPFEQAISNRLSTFSTPPILLTIHSFTPIYLGKERKVEIGIIDDTDDRLSSQMLKLARMQTNRCVELNQPYGNNDNTTHTLSLHGTKNKLLNAMIEVKNDLLRSDEKCDEMALFLAKAISDSALIFGYSIPVKVNHAKDN